MLKINLLPSAARKAEASPVQDLYRMPLVWVVVAALVLGPALLLWLPLQSQKGELAKLQQRIRELEPRKAEVDRLQQTLQQLRAQQAALESMRKEGGQWARRLNVLSEKTPEGIWFTDLAFDESKALIIQGSAVGLEGPAVVYVTQLVNSLTSSEAFASAFKKIEIESIRTTQEGELEVAQFTLTCSLHEVLLP